METEVKIPARDATLDGNLIVPPAARGILLFVHGSGSSRHSKRNRYEWDAQMDMAAALGGACTAVLIACLIERMPARTPAVTPP